MFDLLVAAGDCDDAVIGSWTGVLDADGAARVGADLADARPSFADDGAGSVLRDRHLMQKKQQVSKVLINQAVL